MIRKDEPGFSLLELIIGLVISTPLIILMGNASHSIAKTLIKANEQKQEVVSEMTLIKTLELITADIDSHPFEILPRIHENGIFSYADGSLLEHASIGQSSNGITSFRLNMIDTMQLYSVSGDVRGCLIFRDNATLLSGPTIRSLLLISPTGVFEVPVLVSQHPTPLCYSLQLSIPNRSMVTIAPTASDIALSKIAIPITWTQTFLRDRRGSLRVLRHVGDRVILSQPVAEKIATFNLALSDSPVPSHYEIVIINSRHAEYAFQHIVPRINYRDFLWNIAL